MLTGYYEMPNQLTIGSFDLDLSVLTCDADCRRPAGWTRRERSYSADLLPPIAAPGADEGPPGRIVVTASDEPTESARFRVSVRLPKPVKGIKIAVDLPYMKMLAPEQIELEDAVWRQWDFPRDWRTGFAIWESESRYFTVMTKECPWRFKRLRVLRTGDRMRLEIVQDAALRDRSLTFDSSEWEIGYRTEIDGMLDDYAAFAEQAFGAASFERRADVPHWLRQVGLVVNLHGTDWPGRRNLDYAGMTAAAAALAEQFEPERTILYLIGWDGRYMRNYPDYQPCGELGGRDGFKRFCDSARAHGFHIMPHLNAMAVNMRHPLYLEHLKDYCLRDANGVFQHSYKIDWDQDGLGDAAHAYISLVPPALRDILVDAVERLVGDFGVDSIFLDETCNVFYNDPAWDQVEGVRRLVRDIRRRRPELLIAGEEWNEMLLGLTPLVQIWEETADGRKAFGRNKSPLVRKWASRFVRSCGYLALASPDGTTGVHEWPDKPWVDERENEAFYIPTLSITRDTLQRGKDGIRATIERARDYIRRFTDR